MSQEVREVEKEEEEVEEEIVGQEEEEEAEQIVSNEATETNSPTIYAGNSSVERPEKEKKEENAERKLDDGCIEDVEEQAEDDLQETRILSANHKILKKEIGFYNVSTNADTLIPRGSTRSQDTSNKEKKVSFDVHMMKKNRLPSSLHVPLEVLFDFNVHSTTVEDLDEILIMVLTNKHKEHKEQLQMLQRDGSVSQSDQDQDDGKQNRLKASEVNQSKIELTEIFEKAILNLTVTVSKTTTTLRQHQLESVAESSGGGGGGGGGGGRGGVGGGGRGGSSAGVGGGRGGSSSGWISNADVGGLSQCCVDEADGNDADQGGGGGERGSDGGEEVEVVAFASFYDSPEERVVDSRWWTRWLETGWSNDLGERGYKATPSNSLFLRRIVFNPNFKEIAPTKLLYSCFDSMPLIDYVFFISHGDEMPLTMTQFTRLLPNCLIRTPSMGEEEEEKRISIAVENRFPIMTTPQCWMPTSSFDADDAADRFIGGVENLQLFVADRKNLRPSLVVTSSANVSSLDLEDVMKEEATDKLRALYGEYFLSELIDSNDPSSHTCFTAVDPVSRLPVGFLCVTPVNDLQVFQDDYCVEHLNNLERKGYRNGVAPGFKRRKKKKKNHEVGSVPEAEVGDQSGGGGDDGDGDGDAGEGEDDEDDNGEDYDDDDGDDEDDDEFDLIQDALGICIPKPDEEIEDARVRASKILHRTISKMSSKSRTSKMSLDSRLSRLSDLSLREEKYPSAIKVVIKRRAQVKMMPSVWLIKEGMNIHQKAVATGDFLKESIVEDNFVTTDQFFRMFSTGETALSSIEVESEPQPEAEPEVELKPLPKSIPVRPTGPGKGTSRLSIQSNNSICSSFVPHVTQIRSGQVAPLHHIIAQAQNTTSKQTEVHANSNAHQKVFHVGGADDSFGDEYLDEIVTHMKNENRVIFEENVNSNATNGSREDADGGPPRVDSNRSNVLAATMFFLHSSHDSRAQDLLSHAFLAYPERDFLAITFPRDSYPVSKALDGFTLVPPKPNANPFQDLNVINRACQLDGESFQVKPVTTEAELRGIAALAWKVDANGPHTDVRSVLLDFKFVFDYGADPPETVETAIDVVNKITHLMGADQNGAYAFIAVCNDEVVGYALVADGFIAEEKQAECIREQYDVDGLVNWNFYESEEHGHIHHFVLSPVFVYFEKIFLQEIMRLSKKKSLFYPVYPLYAPNVRYGLLTCMARFLPVAPNKMLQISENVNAPIRRKIECLYGKYSLYYINKRLIHADRRQVTLRIVVVGGSTTGLSFLKALLFVREYLFTNLVLICPEGLPNELYPEPMMMNLLKSVNKWTDRGRIALHSGVKLVRGKVRSIDRVEKFVHLVDGKRVCYDLLILTPGRQFFVPMPMAISSVDSFGVEVYASDSEVISQSASQFSATRERRFPRLHLPVNAVVINSCLEAKLLQRRLLFAFGDRTRKSTMTAKYGSNRVVIYGRGVEIHAAVATAMDAGVTAADLIVVVDQQEDDGIRTEEEIRVLSSLTDYLAKEGVEVRHGVLAEWTWKLEAKRVHATLQGEEKDEKTIESCRFYRLGVTKEGEKKVNCLEETFLISDVEVIVCYSYRETDDDIFNGVNDAGTLVYDGGITINHKFETPDQSVKAAGSATVYARRFYASDEVQSRYCSSEVGERLAKTLVRDLASKASFWDPPGSASPSTTPWSDTIGILPTFKQPVETRCLLINGISYLHVRTANKRYLDYEVAETLKEAGTYDLKMSMKMSFSTGSIAELKTGKTKGYFYLGFDLTSRLSEILCLTGDSASASRLINFRNLHGIHISYLNNLVERFRDETLLDLYDFFAEPWAYALMDQKFQDFRARCEAEANPQRDHWKNLAEHNMLSPSLPYDRILSNSQISELARPLRNFLLNYKSLLPMYASADTSYCRLARKISNSYIGFIPILNARIEKSRSGASHLSGNEGDTNQSHQPDDSDDDSGSDEPNSKSKASYFLYALRRRRNIENIRMLLKSRYSSMSLGFDGR